MKKAAIAMTSTATAKSKVLEVSKLALAALPNIELVSFWIILFTLSMGYRTLYAVYAFVLLEGILYGVHFWWVAYLYGVLLSADDVKMRVVTARMGLYNNSITAKLPAQCSKS